MNNIKDNELFKEMYYKLFNEITNIEVEMRGMAERLKKLQCGLEEFYISQGENNI